MRKAFKKIFGDYYLKAYILLLMLISNEVFCQEIPLNVTKTVESYLVRDSLNKNYLSLVKTKAYILWKMESVKYKSKPYTIYVFGDPTTHTGKNYILFYDESLTENIIIDSRGRILEAFEQLNGMLSETTGLSAENVNLCYSQLVANFYLQTNHPRQVKDSEGK